MADKKNFLKTMMPDLRNRKSRIVSDVELKEMNERIKKEKETGGKIFLIT